MPQDQETNSKPEARTTGYGLEARFFTSEVQIIDTQDDRIILVTSYDAHPRLGGIRDKQIRRSRSVAASSRRGTGSQALMGQILETLITEPTMQDYL